MTMKIPNPRINIEMNPEKVEELNFLIQESGCSTRKEFFNNLIVLYKWMKQKKTDGMKVGAFKDGQYIELEMPILEGTQTTYSFKPSRTPRAAGTAPVFE